MASQISVPRVVLPHAQLQFPTSRRVSDVIIPLKVILVSVVRFCLQMAHSCLRLLLGLLFLQPRATCSSPRQLVPNPRLRPSARTYYCGVGGVQSSSVGPRRESSTPRPHAATTPGAALDDARTRKETPPSRARWPSRARRILSCWCRLLQNWPWWVVSASPRRRHHGCDSRWRALFGKSS